MWLVSHSQYSGAHCHTVTVSAIVTHLDYVSWQDVCLSTSMFRAEVLCVFNILWHPCRQESIQGCTERLWCRLGKQTKKSDCLSCNDLLGLVGCLFLFLLCCRRVLLWKRRGSITMRPHAPQRPGAAASINLLSISCVLSVVPIEHDYMTTAPILHLPLLPLLSLTSCDQLFHCYCVCLRGKTYQSHKN